MHALRVVIPGLALCLLACTEREASTDEQDTGSEEDTGDPSDEPPPGEVGGLCLAPDGHCEADGALCNREENYCFDPEDPCRGFACGGAERGTCEPVDGLPTCECESGYDNTMYALYCCPVDGSDPACG